jgi:hypothetical protein
MTSRISNFNNLLKTTTTIFTSPDDEYGDDMPLEHSCI